MSKNWDGRCRADTTEERARPARGPSGYSVTIYRIVTWLVAQICAKRRMLRIVNRLWHMDVALANEESEVHQGFLCLRSDIELRLMFAEFHYPEHSGYNFLSEQRSHVAGEAAGMTPIGRHARVLQDLRRPGLVAPRSAKERIRHTRMPPVIPPSNGGFRRWRHNKSDLMVGKG